MCDDFEEWEERYFCGSYSRFIEEYTEDWSEE